MPEWVPAQAPYVLQQASAEQGNRYQAPMAYIPGLTSPAQDLSPVAVFTSAKEMLTTR